MISIVFRFARNRNDKLNCIESLAYQRLTQAQAVKRVYQAQREKAKSYLKLYKKCVKIGSDFQKLTAKLETL